MCNLSIVCTASTMCLQQKRLTKATSITDLEHNITPIFHDSRSDPSLQQLLDHGNNFTIIIIDGRVRFASAVCFANERIACKCEMTLY